MKISISKLTATGFVAALIATFAVAVPSLAAASSPTGPVVSTIEPKQELNLDMESNDPEPVKIVDTLIVTEDLLPTRVYVLDGREVVNELPANRLAELKGGPRTATAAAGSATGTVTILPSRIIVVDANDNITSILNNNSGKHSFYSLRVREGGLQGPDHLLTPEIIGQYNSLLALVDWSEKGWAYVSE